MKFYEASLESRTRVYCISSIFLPGIAYMPNIANTTFTLSIRTVSFPCSNSRTKRTPRPDLIAKSSCVKQAEFLSFICAKRF